jgi:uncharacterized SAM-binding protein YcdF (DUF218 family)
VGRTRLRRTVLTGSAVLVAGGLVLALATARLFVWPPSAHPRHVDAVVVLSGDFGDRMPAALALMRRGVAPVLVHAGTPDSAFVDDLCRDGAPTYEVICLRPHPDSTIDEARAIGDLGRQRRWRSIAVVTSSYHVARASISFRRCFDGNVAMVATAPRLGRRHHLRDVPGAWLRVVYLTVVSRGC